MQIGREKAKDSVCADDVIVYIRNPQKSYQGTPMFDKHLSKEAEYKFIFCKKKHPSYIQMIIELKKKTERQHPSKKTQINKIYWS